MKRFAGLSAKDYEFKKEDGTTDRHVIAIYAGSKRVALLEYDTAYKFVHRIHDLAETHDHQQGGSTNG